MNIVLYAPYGLATSHQEVMLELACKQIAAGNNVQVVLCDSSPKTCDYNPTKNRLVCLNCRSTGAASFAKVGVLPKNIHLLDLERIRSHFDVPTFKNVKEMSQFQQDGYNAGWPVAATLVSAFTWDTDPELKPFEAYYKKAIQTSVEIYHFWQSFLESHKTDEVYLFNGRSTLYNPILTASLEKKVKVWVAERCMAEGYVLTKNHQVNDLNGVREELKSFSKKMQEDPNANEIAMQWFEKNHKGSWDLHSNFKEHQVFQKLPTDFDLKKRNVTIFLSSEHELMVEETWKNHLFVDQTEGLKFIVEKTLNSGIHLIIRIHPNLGGRESTQLTQLKKISAPHVKMIYPEDTVDSHYLASVSEKVVVFGSTMGVEAAYLNKAVILAGRSMYESIGACYIPNTREEFLSLVLDKELKPIGCDKALLYGYWNIQRTNPFSYIKPQHPKTKNVTLFQGKEILVPSYFVRALLRIVQCYEAQRGKIEKFRDLYMGRKVQT